MRHRRVWSLVLSGALAALVIGLAALTALTRTERGRERVLYYTLTAVGGALNGSLDVARLDGNLITGAKLYGIVLRGHDGEVVFSADSAFADYQLPSFLRGDVVLNRLVLYDGVVALRKLPGDSLWNYQEILLDTTSTPSQGPPRATLIHQARLVDTRVTVTQAWEPDSAATPAARAREVAAALADTSRIVVDSVAGGYTRTVTFDVEGAGISDLVIAGDERGGTYLRVDSVRAVARLYRGEPLALRGARGEIGLEEGVLRFDFPALLLPGSLLASEGVVDMRGPEPRYDLTLDADTVDLDDMRWLYPHLPDESTAAFRLVLETHDQGILFLVRDLALDAPGTELRGSFGLLVGEETLQFTDANLTAEPLRVQTIEEMLPAGLPVRGLRIGAVEIRSSGRAPTPAG